MASAVMNRQELGQSNILRPSPGSSSTTTTTFTRPSSMADHNPAHDNPAPNLAGLASSSTATQANTRAPISFLDQGIWSDSSFGFNSTTTTRLQPRTSDRSRNGTMRDDLARNDTLRQGSSALLDDSVQDGWGGATSTSSSRLLPHPRRPEASAAPRLPHPNESRPLTTGQSSTSFYSGAPSISLNATGHQAVPSFAGPFAGPSSGNTTFSPPEPPPAVYTKFDRPSPPASQNHAFESASRSHQNSAQPSPSEERRSFIGSSYAAPQSMPSSRNNSLPPSRHGEEYQPHDALAVSRPTVDALRRQSTPHGNPFVPTTNDQISRAALQLGHMSFSDHRSSQSFSTTNGDFAAAHSNDSSMSDNISFTQHLSRRGSRQVDPNQAFASNTWQGLGNGTFGGTDHFYNHQLSRARPEPAYSPRDLVGRTSSISSSSRRDSAQSRELPPIQGAWLNGVAWGQVDHRLREFQHIPGQVDPTYMQMLRMPPPPFIQGPNGMLQPLFPAGAVMGVNFVPAAQDNSGPRVYRSALLEDFRNNKSGRTHELRDLYGHIVEFSGDQHGSRYLQVKIETANSEEKARVFDEILPECHQLMLDVFGNYVVQKFFEHGDQTQKRILAYKMKGHVLMFTMQMYGCRVVQKALETVLNAEKAMLVNELRDHVMNCLKDQNGNHVIQKAIECCPSEMVGFIFDTFRGQIPTLSGHSYGCRAIQRCLEHGDAKVRRMVMSELKNSLPTLIGCQFGNYVVQHVVKHGDAEDRQLVLDIVENNFETFTRHKFASNVVEKCLVHGHDQFRRIILDQIIAGSDRPDDQETMILSFIKDSFGNYVIQTMCKVLCPQDYAQFLEYLQPEINKARRMGCGKQVSSIEKKMVRPAAYNSCRANTYAARAGSAEISPALTTGTSAQTSSISSINGDAVEGAINSRSNNSVQGPFGKHH